MSELEYSNQYAQWLTQAGITPNSNPISLRGVVHQILQNLGSGGGAVASVYGRTGAVVATSGDYTVAQVTGALSATGNGSALTGITAGQVSGAQAGPLTGDVTTSGAAATVHALNGTSLAGLTTGLLKNTTTTGVPSIAVPGTDFLAPTSGSALQKANGLGGLTGATPGTDFLTPTGSGAALTGITESQVSGGQAGPLTGDVTTSGAASTLTQTTNVRQIDRAAAIQAQTRRGGMIGVATSPDASTAFTYGQVEAIIGDSVAAGAGAASFGTTDWPSRLATREARYLGLPDPGIGFVYPTGGGTVYGLPQFSAVGSSLTAVAGYGDPLFTPRGVQLTGTINSTTAANSLTDNRPYERALIFYQPQANSDGIGLAGAAGSTVAHTIDATGIATGGNSTVAFYDTGLNLGAFGLAPIVSLTRVTHVTGSGGVAPIILGVVYYTAGNPGTSGLLMHNLATSGTTTAWWVQNRTWESHIGAVAAQIRRVHIVCGVNDMIKARSSTTAVANGTSTVTDANGAFSDGDIGRPVTGTDMPSPAYIGQINSATSIGLSSSPTTNTPVNATGSGSGLSVTYGAIPLATTTANLTTLISRIRVQAPNVAITLVGEYHPSATNFSESYWANTFIPAVEAVAYATNCAFVDLFSVVGSIVSIRTVSDAVTNGTATVTSATAAFVSSDVGSIVTGTNIPGGPVYVGVINSGTSVGLSSSPVANVPVVAGGSGSGGTLNIGNDVYQLGLADGIHLGDAVNSTGKVDGQQFMANAYWERLGYSQALPAPLVAQGAVVIITGTTWVCPATGVWRITCLGGGGGQGEWVQGYQTLTQGVGYAVTIGAGGTAGTAGAVGGHAGVSGGNGGNTTFAGTTNIVAQGGGGGLSATASSTGTTTSTTGGGYGYPGNTTTAISGVPGCGGFGAIPASFIGNGSQGGAPIGCGSGGGGGSGGCTGGVGGGGGVAGNQANAGGGAGGTAGGGSGANGTAATGTVGFGGGGGAGGPASTVTGTAGAGAVGGGGMCILEKVG